MKAAEDTKAFGFPQGFISWESVVGHGGRMYVPFRVLNRVDWLRDVPRDEAVDCFARVGPFQQLIFFPKLPDDLAGIAKTVAGGSDEQLEHPETLDLVQYASSFWRLRLSSATSNKRREFTIPRGARTIGGAPHPGEGSVFFAAKSRLELWRGARWLERMAGIDAGRADRIAAVQEFLVGE
jgi:hypothetical protein